MHGLLRGFSSSDTFETVRLVVDVKHYGSVGSRREPDVPSHRHVGMLNPIPCMSAALVVTSADLNSVRKDKTSNPSMTIGRWLRSGSMFALEFKGTRVIPAYALDQLGEPIALLKPVLSLMKGRTSFLIAAWLESPNTHLNGKRPRELLATRGLDVVRAAEMHVAEDFHG